MLTEGVFWAALGAFLALTLAYFALLVWKAQQSNSPPWLSALVFLGAAFTFMWRANKKNNVATSIMGNCPLTTRISQMFNDVWGLSAFRDKWDAVSARTHYGLTIICVILSVTAFIIFGALLTGIL